MAHIKYEARGAKVGDYRGYTDVDQPPSNIDRLVVQPEIESPITPGTYECRLGLSSRMLKLAIDPKDPESFQISLSIDPRRMHRTNMGILADYLQARNAVGMPSDYTTDEELNCWINFQFTPEASIINSHPSTIDTKTILIRSEVRDIYEDIEKIEDGITPSAPTPPWIGGRLPNPMPSFNFD